MLTARGWWLLLVVLALLGFALASGAATQSLHVLRMAAAYDARGCPSCSTRSSHARSRSAMSRAPIHQTIGWNQKIASVSRWIEAIRLSRRMT